MRLDEGFLKRVLPQAHILHGQLPPEFLACAVDSRVLSKKHIFFALEGAQVDGHSFISEALKKSAGIVIAQSKEHLVVPLLSQLPSSFVVAVPDPLHALIALATAWRSQFTYPVAAITGSVGKTSTKETVAHMLVCSGKNYLVSKGNLNTLIGVALTISLMDESYAGAVFEVGISKQGEMEKIVDMLQPTTGLITCVAHSHMEGLGTVGGIAAEKRALFKNFGPENIGIVYGDQPLLSTVSYHHPVIKFGMKTTNQVQARKLKEQEGKLTFLMKLYDKKHFVTLSKNHRGFVNNILGAATLAYQLGVADTAIVEAINTLPVCAQRFEICALKNRKGVLIDDCYNSSPESVKAALLALQSMHCSGIKIAVLGDMLELGANSSFWHRQIGRFLRKITTVRHLILVGEHVKWIEKTAPLGMTIEKARSWQDAVSKLSATLEDDAVVLVKGSRGMQLQNVVAEFVDKQVQI